MAGNKIRFGFDVDDGGAIKKINKFNDAFDKVAGKGGSASLFGNVAAKGVAMGFNLIGDAIGGVTNALGDALAMAQEDQVSQERLRVALENNVRAWDGNTAAVEEYVDAQTARGFADDQTREGLGQLVGITHNVVEAQNLLIVAEDLARAKGLDLATATDIVTKAAQGNGKALKALGIETAGATDATSLLNAIIKNTTGSADAYNQTLAGKVNVSQLQFNEAMEEIGYQIMPVVANVMNAAATEWLPALGRGWNKVLNAIKPVLNILGAIIDRIRDLIGWIDKMTKKLDQVGKLGNAIPPIPGLPLPHFAKGGIVSTPTVALVGENGPERITPLGKDGGGFTIQGVSERQIVEMVDRGLFFQLRRAASTSGRV